MRNLNELDSYRINDHLCKRGPMSGAFKVFVGGRSFQVIASVDNCGPNGVWEHVSASPRNQKRCPTWEEMVAIKDMFFLPEEEAIQFHPKHSEYMNMHPYCLHIWKPVTGAERLPKITGGIDTLEDRDALLEEIWEKFGDVPVNQETEKLEDDFLHFKKGTDKEDVWHWFDERHSKGIAYLLYGGSEDYVPETKRLYALKQLCLECESSSCRFNHGGECRFALVHERKPEINDIDGCIDYDYAEAF